MFKLIKTIGFLLLYASVGLAQSLVEQIDPERRADVGEALNLPRETVEKISPSGRIYLLSNGNSSFEMGDFITLVLGNSLVARALVAKVSSGTGAVKIVKIYSSEILGSLKPGAGVRIIRGDDSWFKKKIEESKKPKLEEELEVEVDGELLQGEDLLGDVEALDKGKRLIKQDNIVSFLYGRVEGRNLDGATARYGQFGGAWAYQVMDNIWTEASYTQNTISDFPQVGLSTRLSSIGFRVKYLISAPAYSFISPYFGYQVIDARSPSAGVQNPAAPASPEQLNLEIIRLESLKKKSLVFGISVLKRLVPGWFVRLDVGSDILSGGFALEF